MFSKVKSELKAMDSEAQVLDLETLILAAFSFITSEDCQKMLESMFSMIV